MLLLVAALLHFNRLLVAMVKQHVTLSKYPPSFTQAKGGPNMFLLINMVVTTLGFRKKTGRLPEVHPEDMLRSMLGAMLGDMLQYVFHWNALRKLHQHRPYIIENV